MKRTPPILGVLLLLAPLAAAQTTTTQINPGTCVHVNNCILPLANGNRVWVSNPYFVQVLDPVGNYLANCHNITVYNLTTDSQSDLTLHVVCENITVDETGYSFYQRGGGGRGGGGAGTRYHINGGTVTY